MMIIPTSKTTIETYEEYLSELINREQSIKCKLAELYHNNYEFVLEILDINGRIEILKQELNKEDKLPLNSDICQSFAYIRDTLITKVNMTCKAISHLKGIANESNEQGTRGSN